MRRPRPATTATSLPWPWRVAVVLAILVGGALLAAALAYWGWRWFSPSVPPAPPAATSTSIDRLIAAAPFGRAEAPPPSAPTGPAPAGPPPGLPADARLLGVFAGRDGEGYALLRLPDVGPLLVRRGQDIVPGTRLDAVRPDSIDIIAAGGTREIVLRPDPAVGGGAAAGSNAGARPPARGPAPSSAGPGGASGPSAQVAAAHNPACIPPAGFSGATYRLNAELLTGMAAQPQSWAALLAPKSGVLVVRDETGLASMLGMKAGDRLQDANGIALTTIDDVLAAVVKPLVASQQVRLKGNREGRTREWLFLNAGSCPVGSRNAPAVAAAAGAGAAAAAAPGAGATGATAAPATASSSPAPQAVPAPSGTSSSKIGSRRQRGASTE